MRFQCVYIIAHQITNSELLSVYSQTVSNIHSLSQLLGRLASSIMCTFRESVYVICQHIKRQNKVCRSQKGGHRWLFSSSCAETMSIDHLYSLCPECCRVFASRGLPLPSAINIYRSYRQEHQYYGALTPHTLSNRQIVLRRDPPAPIFAAFFDVPAPALSNCKDADISDHNERLLSYIESI